MFGNQKGKNKGKEEQPKTGAGITDFINLNMNNLKPTDHPSNNSPKHKLDDKKHKKKDFVFIIPKATKNSSELSSSTASHQTSISVSHIETHQSIINQSTESIIPNLSNNQLQQHQHSDNNNSNKIILNNFSQSSQTVIEQRVNQPMTSTISSPSLIPPTATLISISSINKNDPPQIIFEKETKQTNIFLFNQIEDYKLIIKKINQIRTEVQKDKETKESITQLITELTSKQNQLIEINNFDEAIKVEEEIKENINKIKVIDYSIRIQTETNLNKLNLEIMDLFKTIVTQLNNQVDKISLLLDDTIAEKETLNQTEKRKLDELSAKIDQKTIDTNKLHIVLQSSIRQVNNEEKFFNKQIENEAGHLLKLKEDLKNQKDTVEKEIEELRKQLEAAKASLHSIEQEMESNEMELEKIKLKYEMDESYKLALLSKETSQSFYNESSSELNKMKEIYSKQNDVFNSKIEDISKIIAEINDYKTIKHPKYKQIMLSIIGMRDIVEKEKENYNKKHINENKIEEYSNKLIENNEKIEEIALQNKRIQSDILSLESNITNLDDVKKAHVAKKQFKDAQAVTIEIKKYIENKAALIEVFNENNEEVGIIKKEIENLNRESENIKKEIEDITKQINESHSIYLKMYSDILVCFHEELFKDCIDPDNDNDVISDEIKLIKLELDIENKTKENAIDIKTIDNKNCDETNNKEVIDKDSKEIQCEIKTKDNKLEHEQGNIIANDNTTSENELNIIIAKEEGDKNKQESIGKEPINCEDKVQSKECSKRIEEIGNEENQITPTTDNPNNNLTQQDKDKDKDEDEIKDEDKDQIVEDNGDNSNNNN